MDELGCETCRAPTHSLIAMSEHPRGPLEQPSFTRGAAAAPGAPRARGVGHVRHLVPQALRLSGPRAGRSRTGHSLTPGRRVGRDRGGDQSTLVCAIAARGARPFTINPDSFTSYS